MQKSNNLKKNTIEWQKKSDNIGVVTPWPTIILEHYLDEKGLLNILDLFWNKDTTKVNLLDLCVLEGFWWKNEEIVAARSSWLTHPTHHSSEYIFDKQNTRLIITVRQPDLNGDHWNAQHIHLTLGEKSDDPCKIEKVFMKPRHIKLEPINIFGKYICKIKD